MEDEEVGDAFGRISRELGSQQSAKDSRKKASAARAPGVPKPEDIVRYLFRNYEPYLNRMNVARKKVWGAKLFPEDAELLIFPDFNRLKHDFRGPLKADVIERLYRPETLEWFATSIRCPRIFECQTLDEIAPMLAPQLVAGASPWEGAPRALTIPEPLPERLPCVSNAEELVVKRLAARLEVEPDGVFCWKEAPAIGSALIAYALGGTYLSSTGKACAYLLRPHGGYAEGDDFDGSGGGEAPFQRSLAELRKSLELPPEASDKLLLQSLANRDALVIVLNPGLMATARSGIRSLLRTASGQKKGWKFLLMGDTDLDANDCRRLINLPLTTPSAKDRNAFFERQWQRFCEIRGQVPADRHGTRLMRARGYFARKASRSSWPASIRMLAFLASNYRTFGYFDPTAGWAALAGMEPESLPIDIRLHMDETYALLRTWSADAPAMRALEWCSTALYWLTEKMAIELAKLPPGSRLYTFRSAVLKLQEASLVTIDRNDTPDFLDDDADTDETSPEAVDARKDAGEIYKMDLATRALVQDLWARSEPLARARAHYAVAWRLYHRRDDKELLSAEFDVEPHWGRSRIHFLSECLRHLVRACAHEPDAAYGRRMAEFSQEFPNKPADESTGCDAGEVINFCFAKIFWQELNGNLPSGQIHNRKLARQHGAYQLVGELLELLSAGQELGRPHPALHPRHCERYYREAAYAQMDLGDLEGALLSCERLIKHADTGEGITDANAQYHLDRIVVLTAMHRLDDAERRLEEIERRYPSRGAKHDKIGNRIRARRAQLHYLRGDLLAALRTYEQIAEADATALTRDVAHGYIATLGALGDEVYIDRALTVCLQNLFDNTSRGWHHVALGFRIALGHLLRKMGRLVAAERTLDQVFGDVLKFGCSERTHLAFLLEAGRIVSQAPDRLARAYAAYLRPCFDRAVSLGYERAAEVARRHAERCLRGLLDQLEGPEGARMDVRGMLEDERNIKFVTRLPDVDPRYAFGVEQVAAWSARLETRAAILRELEALDAPGAPWRVRGQAAA